MQPGCMVRKEETRFYETMRKFALLLLLLAGGTSIQTRAGLPRDPEKARLTLDHTAHDFGEVPRKGGNIEHGFPFTNDGKVPLVIVRAQTSCTCLKITYPKRPVAPGSSDTIRVVYEPHKSEPGSFNKLIQIFSNAENSREILTVQGFSIEEGATKVKVKREKTKIKN